MFTRDTDSLSALKASGVKGPVIDFGPDATFVLDLHATAAADKLLKEHGLEPGRFLCAVPGLRRTPCREIRTGVSKPNPQRSAVNEQRSAVNEAFADRDHAKLRAAVTTRVRETGHCAFLVPVMTCEVFRLHPFAL